VPVTPYAQLIHRSCGHRGAYGTRGAVEQHHRKLGGQGQHGWRVRAMPADEYRAAQAAGPGERCPACTGPAQGPAAAPADPMNDEAMLAAVDLVRRSGARNVDVGYLHEGRPVAEADWYAHAQYRGARITSEHHVGPVEALEGLAERVLTGAKCGGCGGLVALRDDGAYAFDVILADGTSWTTEQAAAAGLCHWRRVGARWRMGCEETP
jgi:hypothetical protein